MKKPYPGDITPGSGCIEPTEGSGGGWVDPGSQDIEGVRG